MSARKGGSRVGERGGQGRGAAGAERGGVWGGGVPLPNEEGSGEGAVPPPQKIF